MRFCLLMVLWVCMGCRAHLEVSAAEVQEENPLDCRSCLSVPLYAMAGEVRQQTFFGLGYPGYTKWRGCFEVRASAEQYSVRPADPKKCVDAPVHKFGAAVYHRDQWHSYTDAGIMDWLEIDPQGEYFLLAGLGTLELNQITVPPNTYWVLGFAPL